MAISLRRQVTFQIVATLGASLLLGVSTFFLSPLWTLIGLAVLAFAIAVLKWPEIGLLGYLVITSTFLDQNSLPRVAIGFGRLVLTDIILIALLGLILIRRLVARESRFIHTPLDMPLLAFVGTAILSTVLAIVRGPLTFNESLGYVRVIISYLTFFIVTNLVRRDAQVRGLLRGLFLLATIVAAATIAQYMLGTSVRVLAGRLEALGTEGAVSLSETTRVIPPGQSIMMVAFIATFATLVMQPARPSDVLKFFECGLLGLGIVVTFFRASWGAIALAALLLGFLANSQERRRLVLWVLAAILSVIVILMAVMEQPQSRGATLAQAAFARLGTLANAGTYVDPGSSLRWRDFEYSYALPEILARPVLGSGLGFRYRPLTNSDGINFDGRRFVHNGHVYILLDAGILGYLGLLCFLVGVLVRGLRNWRRMPHPYTRGLVLAFALTSLVVLIVSIVEPYVAEWPWTPLIGIIAGINEVAIRKANQQTAAELI